MSTALQICFNFSATKLNTSHGFNNKCKHKKPINFGIKLSALHQKSSFELRVHKVRERYCLFGEEKKKLNGIFLRDVENKKRVVMVRFNQGFGFNGGGGSGGGGGGGNDDGTTTRVLGNLALAIGLTYLSLTGQLGWLLDAIVSIWLLAVIIPIVGIGAFIWWAGRDIVQSSCPNCGNEFQIFKSTMNEELQLCPYCTQPFSVVDNKFVRDSVKFSNESTTFADAFKDFSRPIKRKGKKTSPAIVDIEAEVKDVD